MKATKIIMGIAGILMVSLLYLSGCGGGNPAGGGGGTGGGGAGAAALTAPTLSATPTSSSSISLSWNAVSGATTYNVWAVPTTRYLPAGMNAVLSLVASTSATGYTVNGLTANTNYIYYVNAIGTNNTASPNSASASAMTLAGGTLPAVPTGLTAAAGLTNVNLSWTAVPGAKSYTIAKWVAAFGGGSNYSPIVSVTGTNYNVTGLVSGSPYSYAVMANNDSGSSAYTAWVNVTTMTLLSWTPPATPAVPAAPTGLAGTVITPGEVDVSWNQVGGATSYNVYNALGTNAVSIIPGNKLGNTTGTSMQNWGLVAGNTYSYIVTALNATGESMGSTILNVTIPVGSLAAPVVTSTQTMIYTDPQGKKLYQDTVSINQVTGNYNIYTSGTSGGPYALATGINSIPFNSYGYYQSIITPGTWYFGVPGLNGWIWPITTSAYPGGVPLMTKYLVMTRVDGTGKESAFSNEVVFHSP